MFLQFAYGDHESHPCVTFGNYLLLAKIRQTKFGSNISNECNNQQEYQMMSSAHNPYGDGKASGRIVEEILRDSQT